MIRVRNIDKWLQGVISLAFVSLVMSIGVLFTSVDPDLVGRANVSLAISTSLALILGMIAVIITTSIGGSEYRARESLKKDLATLSVTLAVIFEKAGIILTESGMSRTTGHPLNIDTSFRHEKMVIRKILASTTGFAIYCWVQDKSKMAKGNPESWRAFTMDLQYLIVTPDETLSNYLFNRKQQNDATLSLLEQLSDRDINAMCTKVMDLEKSLEIYKAANHENAMMRVFRGKTDKQQAKAQ